MQKKKFKSYYSSYIDAIPSNLPPKERAWYKSFIDAYYYRNKKAMDSINMPVQMRRDLYNRHRGVCNDVMNRHLTDSFIDIEEVEGING